MDGGSLKYQPIDFQTPNTKSSTRHSVNDAIICWVLERGSFMPQF